MPLELRFIAVGPSDHDYAARCKRVAQVMMPMSAFDGLDGAKAADGAKSADDIKAVDGADVGLSGPHCSSS